MFDSTIHLAPNAPWLWLGILSLTFVVLSLWAYRFVVPPLPVVARRALAALRALALLVLLWLLAQPVLERARGSSARLVVLLDRSRSMDLPAASGGPSRARAADEVVEGLRRGWRGRAGIEVLSFAGHLGPDSGRGGNGGRTSLGDALSTLAQSPSGQMASGVVVVSDGRVNAGQDPVAAARRLGMPVHAVVVGASGLADRTVTGIETRSQARVGKVTPLRVRISTTDERGTPMGVRLMGEGRELERSTVFAPGGGAEVTAEFRVTPVKAGLAVWTVRVDTLADEISTTNNERQVAIEVSPGQIGVYLLSAGLNWDLSFIRRSLMADSSLRLTTWVRGREGWSSLEGARAAGPDPADLRAQTVVVLDAIAPGELPGAFDHALSEHLREGRAILALGGPPPGLARYRGGRLGTDLATPADASRAVASAAPAPSSEARELLAWDDDPARGERAWRAAAPLSHVLPLSPGAGDRVLIAGRDGGPPLAWARRIGRGQALLVNGTGLWRWSLSGHDDRTAERGRRLWRGLVHWLAEPVQAEPLRVRPERWLTPGGEPVRLFATLQDEEFRPVADAAVDADVRDERGRARRIEFAPQAAGSYVAMVEDLPPGRYRVAARATRASRELAQAATEMAVDRWSLEEANALPDSSTLAAVAAAASGGLATSNEAERWARALEPRVMTRGRSESLRLWESPWVFGAVVGLLSLEWVWRRRRGLP